MIVVIGHVNGRSGAGPDIEPAGFAAIVGIHAARAGARVELVTRVGDDATGDAVLLALARVGVGHVATLRDAAHPTPIVADDDQPLDDDAAADTAVPREEGAREGPPTGPSIEAADVGLALRYLTDYRVLVVAHPTDTAIVDEAVEAAGWSGAHLVIVTEAANPVVALPAKALQLVADPDAEGTAGLLGRYAAAVDDGEDLDTAYAVLTGANAER